MSRDGLPRAYLRIDPNIDQVYPELRSTFVGLLCAAHRQPDRGRFRSRELLEALCGEAYIAAAYARGDLQDLADGRVYVPGWDEWQEGDLTVAERMKRMRARRRQRDGRVTLPPSPRRPDVTTDAPERDLVVSSVGVSVGVDVTPPPRPRAVGRSKDRSPTTAPELDTTPVLSPDEQRAAWAEQSRLAAGHARHKVPEPGCAICQRHRLRAVS